MTPYSLRLAIGATVASVMVAGHALAQSSPARPGDRIVLRLFRDTVAVDTIGIDPAGNTVLPLAGDVRLAGVPASAIQDSVRSALKPYLKPSLVQVTLVRRIAIGGEVFKPGVYYLDWSYAIRDAIAEAGGATLTGRWKRVLLERNGTERRLDNWSSGDEGLELIESGDRLFVERVSWMERNVIQLVTATGVIASIVVSRIK